MVAMFAGGAQLPAHGLYQHELRVITVPFGDCHHSHHNLQAERVCDEGQGMCGGVLTQEKQLYNFFK